MSWSVLCAPLAPVLHGALLGRHVGCGRCIGNRCARRDHKAHRTCSPTRGTCRACTPDIRVLSRITCTLQSPGWRWSNTGCTTCDGILEMYHACHVLGPVIHYTVEALRAESRWAYPNLLMDAHTVLLCSQYSQYLLMHIRYSCEDRSAHT